jgi:plastocyanin
VHRHHRFSSPRRVRFAALAAAVATALLAACSDSSQPPPQPVVTPVDRATAGAITATVTYDGPVPEPIEINMRASGRCAELHDGPVYEQPVKVGAGRLADVLVYVKSGLGDRKFQFPTTPAIVDQRGCLYQPRVVALMVGQPLQFTNSDPEAHNVRGRPAEVDAWNFMMSRKGAERTLYFDKPEIGIRVGCDVHPWMSAWVSVLDHPYFAITGANGEVEIAGMPPGDYVVGTWHETLGTREQAVSLPAGGAARLEFAY